MSVKLSISVEEANLICGCLGFLKRNLSLVPDGSGWRFVSGKDFSLTVGERCRLELLAGYIQEAREEAIETHPFNPYITTF